MTAPDPRLDEIQARLDAATPGPWKTESVERGMFAGIESRVYSLRGSHILLSPVDGESGQAKTSDATFIANAPADVRFLLAELRKAHEALERVEALCADEESRMTAKSYVPVDSIRAAVAAAKGDERG